MGFLSSLRHAASGAGSFLASHWTTIAVVAAVVVVGVTLTVASGGLLGVPALAALGGGVIGGGGLAATAASAIGAFGAGVTGYLLGNALNHRASSWKQALVEGAKSTLLTFATLGLAKGLGFLAPYAGRALEPVTKPVGEAIAPFVRPIAESVANAAKPLTNAVSRSLDAVSEAGQGVRRGVLEAVGHEPPPAVDANTAAREWADYVRENSPSKAKTPHVSAIVRDRRTGAIYNGTSGDSFEPYPIEVHPDLAARLPSAPVVAGRPFPNCAEFKAVNKALLSGARWEDLEPPIALITRDGFPIEFCPNCQTWVPRPFVPASAAPLVANGTGQALGASQTDGIDGSLDKIGKK